jgi:hypothetical protein
MQVRCDSAGDAESEGVEKEVTCCIAPERATKPSGAAYCATCGAKWDTPDPKKVRP